MSEKKLTGFAALMKMRRLEAEKKKQEPEKMEKEQVKPVIKEVSLTSIDERIRQLEQQLEDSEGDEFVDVDSEGSSDSEGEKQIQTEKRSKDVSSDHSSTDLLSRMKQALQNQQGEVELGDNEAYCEICSMKLQGDIEISTHIESAGHLRRLKIAFKNDLYSSSHTPNSCTTCGVSFSSSQSLIKHRDFRGHANNAKMKKRLCYCTLCKKQFTSGQQLTEHFKGKAHKEKLQHLSDKQAKFKRMRGGDTNEGPRDKSRRMYPVCFKHKQRS